MAGLRIYRENISRIIISAGLLMTLLPCVSANAGSVAAGKTLYQTHCEICHGQSGRPAMAGAPDFTRGDGLFQSDAAIFDAIRSSEIIMHGFSGLLRDEEIFDIITFIRTLY